MTRVLDELPPPGADAFRKQAMCKEARYMV